MCVCNVPPPHSAHTHRALRPLHYPKSCGCDWSGNVVAKQMQFSWTKWEQAGLLPCWLAGGPGFNDSNANATATATAAAAC